MNCGFCNDTLNGKAYTGHTEGKIACPTCYERKHKEKRDFTRVLINAGEIVAGIAHPKKIAIDDYVLIENGQAVAAAFPTAGVWIRFWEDVHQCMTLREYANLPKETIDDIRDVIITSIDQYNFAN